MRDESEGMGRVGKAKPENDQEKQMTASWRAYDLLRSLMVFQQPEHDAHQSVSLQLRRGTCFKEDILSSAFLFPRMLVSILQLIADIFSNMNLLKPEM